jgi:hypothetical protein
MVFAPRRAGGSNEGATSGGAAVLFVSVDQPDGDDSGPCPRFNSPGMPKLPVPPGTLVPGAKTLRIPAAPPALVHNGACDAPAETPTLAGHGGGCKPPTTGELPTPLVDGVLAGGGLVTPNASPNCRNPSVAVPSVCSAVLRKLLPVNSSCRPALAPKSCNCALKPSPTFRVPSRTRLPLFDNCWFAC